MTFVRWRKRRAPPVTVFLHSLAAFLVLFRVCSWFGISSRVADTAFGVRDKPQASPQHAGNRLLNLARRGRHDVRVFVYNLPPKFNTLQVARSHQRPAPIRDPYCDENFYSAEVTVHKQLLKSAARTKNPDVADFFYVPIYVTCFLINNHPNNLTKTGMFFEDAMDYVTQKYPYFNASQGRDHVFTFTQGFGARLSGPRWREWSNAIFLTHNGDFESEEYTPRKDIVIPPDLSHYLIPVYDDPIKRPSLTLERRKFLAHFGGQSFSSKISDHRGSNYSGGVRQYFASELYRFPGFRITGTRSDDYLDDMHNSMFCLAPEGWHPWSPRPYYGLLLGCVPVVLSERQELAFEDVVPYDDIVVWVRPDDVFSLNSILRSITSEDIMRRLQLMEKLWPMFWYGEHKGAAMDTILGELSRHKYISHPRRHYRRI